MNNLKIKTDHGNNKIASVILNGEEIGYKISTLTLQMRGGEIPKALIEVPLDDIEVEGDYEVLKKIKKEESDNHGTVVNIKTNKDFQETVDRIEGSREEYRKIASQIIDVFHGKKLLTCEAKIILGLCDDIINVNSSINKTRNNCDFIPRSSDGPSSGPIVSFSNC